MDDEKIRHEFELWVKFEMTLSIDRYDRFPFSYKNNDVNTMWAAWSAAWRKKND